ncbi:MAG: 8-amino-7-oxononanoate synthase [Acidaminococcaceae bacterium]
MSKLEASLAGELAQLQAQGLARSIKDLRFVNAATAVDATGKEYVVFASNNYLGLTHAPEVIAAAQEATRYGTGSGGSRLTTGGHFEVRELETALAEFKHTESALVFNTGYMTNLGVLYALVRPGDVVFSDALNHASIIDGCRIARAQVRIYPHGDMAALEQLLAAEHTTGFRYLVTDGVFSMDGDIAPLPELVALAAQYEACLIVDDAHAVGVIGTDGSGTAAFYGLQGQVDLQVGTLSKALAAEGGYVAGKKVFIDYLINKSRPFIFSTALSPAPVAAARAALELLQTKPRVYLDKLWFNAKLMRKLLVAGGLEVIPGETPIIPIMVGSAALTTVFADRLAAQGILVSGIRPPTVPQGASRLRLTVTAAHSEAQLRRAAKLVLSVWQELTGKKEEQ